MGRHHLFARSHPPIGVGAAFITSALRGKQEQTNRFFGVVEGTVSFAEFFASANLQQIMAATGEGAMVPRAGD